MGLKDLGVSPLNPENFLKKFSKTFDKMQFHCIFRKNKFIHTVEKVWF